MTARRDASVAGTCSCGCDWFVLDGSQGGAPPNLPHGGVNIDSRGRITTHTGAIVCARPECGKVWTPPRDRLRVVPGGDAP